MWDTWTVQAHLAVFDRGCKYVSTNQLCFVAKY